VIRIISGVGPRDSCRNLFKELDILPLSGEYILSLMLFVVDNQNKFCSGLEVHGLNIRSRNQLYLPILNLSVFQKDTKCTGIRLLIDCPWPFKVLERIELVLKTIFYILWIIHFIQLLNFWSIEWTISLNCVLLSCVFCCCDMSWPASCPQYFGLMKCEIYIYVCTLKVKALSCLLSRLVAACWYIRFLFRK
jgi:hypothetical protein